MIAPGSSFVSAAFSFLSLIMPRFSTKHGVFAKKRSITMGKLVLAFFLFWIPFSIECIEKPDDWQRVYLATFPRSGNHWMRYLIEEATHITTSSVYQDADQHLSTPFPWGGYCADHGYEGNCRYPSINEITVIKTHFPAYPAKSFDQLQSIKTIRIIRHPLDSFYSFCVYENGKKQVNQISKKRLTRYVNIWKRFQTFWNKEKNVITLFYEDFLIHPKENLQILLSEIGYPVFESDIERALAKHPPRGHELKYLPFYTDEQLEFIQAELGDLMDLFNYKIPDLPNLIKGSTEND